MLCSLRISIAFYTMVWLMLDYEAQIYPVLKIFVFLFFFFLFIAAPEGYGSSWVRGWKWAAAVAHATVVETPDLSCILAYAIAQGNPGSLTHWAEDQTQILTEMLGFQPTEPQWERFKLCFTFIACSDTILLSLYIHLLCTFIFDFSFSIPFLFQLMIFIFTLISVFYKKKLQHWVFENP